jgi:serine O-acetyltransferase
MDSIKGLFAEIASDYRAHGRDWTRPGFRTVAVYRFGVWRMSIRSKLLRAGPSIVYRMMFRHCRNVYGIELPYSCKVGKRVVIEHQGGIVVHGNTELGDDTIIRQNCTFGLRHLDRLTDAPILGKGVNVGAGAVVLGRITVGDGAAIAANAVVLTDVPAGATVGGVPAKVLKSPAPGGRPLESVVQAAD